MRKEKYCSVVIVAAGKGKRMQANINKQYLLLDNKPVLAHTIEVFEKCDAIDEIVVVTGEDEIEYFRVQVKQKYDFSKIRNIVAGGKERQQSVYNGLMAAHNKTNIVLIHDGARPFIKQQQILDSIDVAIEMGGCAVGVPVKDTIKICDENQEVMQTPDRSSLWAVQTPQTFRYELLVEAHKKAQEEEFIGTDDAMLVEKMGHKLKIISGRYDNIKLTTPEDLEISKSFLRQKYKKN